MKNYHRILGVSEDAEPEEIKAAYRKLAKKYHPDSHPDDPNIKKKFQEISEAYEALRKEWSRYGHFQSSFREEPRPKWSFHREIRIPVHLELEETLVEVEKDVTYLIRLSHDLGYEMLKCRIKIPGGAYQYKKIPLQDVICEGQEENKGKTGKYGCHHHYTAEREKRVPDQRLPPVYRYLSGLCGSGAGDRSGCGNDRR